MPTASAISSSVAPAAFAAFVSDQMQNSQGICAATAIPIKALVLASRVVSENSRSRVSAHAPAIPAFGYILAKVGTPPSMASISLYVASAAAVASCATAGVAIGREMARDKPVAMTATPWRTDLVIE